MLHFFLLLLSSANGFAAPAAKPPPCYDSTHAAKLIKEFNVDVQTFPNGRDLCSRDNALVWFLMAIDFVDNQKWDGSATPLGPAILSNDYSSFLRTSIKKVSGPYRADRVCGIAKGKVACMTGIDSQRIEPGEMFITSEFPKRQDVAILSGVLIHESRHHDPLQVRGHVPCDHGARKDIPGTCDEKFSDGGSYSVELEYLTRLVLHAPNISFGSRDYIRMAAFSLAAISFNETPMAPRPTLALSNAETGEVTLYDGQNQIRLKGTETKGARIFGRERNLSVLPKDGSAAFVKDLYSFSTIPEYAQSLDILGLTLQEYNQKSAEEKTKLLDIQETNSFDNFHEGLYGRLFSNRLDLLSKKLGKYVQAPLPEGTFSQFVSHVSCGNTDALSPYEFMFLRNSAGDLFQVHVEEDIKVEKLHCKWPDGVNNEFKLGASFFRLMEDGRFLRSADGKEWALDPNFAGQKIEEATKIATSYFWGWLSN